MCIAMQNLNGNICFFNKLSTIKHLQYPYFYKHAWVPIKVIFCHLLGDLSQNLPRMPIILWLCYVK